MKEAILFFLTFLTIVFISGICFFVNNQTQQLYIQTDKIRKTLEESEKTKNFLTNILEKKDKEGNPIWMIVVGIAFFIFLVIRLLTLFF